MEKFQTTVNPLNSKNDRFVENLSGFRLEDLLDRLVLAMYCILNFKLLLFYLRINLKSYISFKSYKLLKEIEKKYPLSYKLKYTHLSVKKKVHTS